MVLKDYLLNSIALTRSTLSRKIRCHFGREMRRKRELCLFVSICFSYLLFVDSFVSFVKNVNGERYTRYISGSSSSSNNLLILGIGRRFAFSFCFFKKLRFLCLCHFGVRQERSKDEEEKGEEISSATGYIIDKWSRNIYKYQRKYDDRREKGLSFLSFFRLYFYFLFFCIFFLVHLFAYIMYLEN